MQTQVARQLCRELGEPGGFVDGGTEKLVYHVYIYIDTFISCVYIYIKYIMYINISDIYMYIYISII